jgi:tRNA C32,U32 (ribose-2'-O)-methylase TrmJ
VRVPTEPALPSLNLAQAVALFAYEVHEHERRAVGAPPGERCVASVAELEGFYGQFERVLVEVGFIEEASPARMMGHVRRIFSRRLPDPRDVRILRGILSKVEGALARERGSKG